MRYIERDGDVVREYEGTPQEIVLLKSALTGEIIEVPPRKIRVEPLIDVEAVAKAVDEHMRRSGLVRTGNSPLRRR